METKQTYAFTPLQMPVKLTQKGLEAEAKRLGVKPDWLLSAMRRDWPVEIVTPQS